MASASFKGFSAKMVDPPTYAGDLELYDAWILQVELYLTNIGLDW